MLSGMEGYLISLIFKGMQNKMTVRCYLMPVRMAIIKKTRDNFQWECGENGPLNTVGGSVYWCSHYGKLCGGSSKN